MRDVSLVLAATLAFSGAAAAQDAAEGERLFGRYCAACHGDDARGSGVMTEVLNVVPPDLTVLGQGEAFPLLQVVRQIDGREPMLAHGGEMPIFGMWFDGDGPDVALPGPGGQPLLVSGPIGDLVAYLISVQS